MAIFTYPGLHFLFALGTPLWQSRKTLHEWKDNSVLAKPLAACTHLSSTVSQLFEPQVQKIAVYTMDGKTIQCLPNPSQHISIYLQQFSSYSNRKCKKSQFSRIAAHIFVSPGDAPATITQYDLCMKRQFNACQTHCSMYLSIFNSFRVIHTMLKSMRKSKNRYFYHIFLSPGDVPGAITLNVVWMEREFDAYKLSRCMCPSSYNRFWDRVIYL